MNVSWVVAAVGFVDNREQPGYEFEIVRHIGRHAHASHCIGLQTNLPGGLTGCIICSQPAGGRSTAVDKWCRGAVICSNVSIFTWLSLLAGKFVALSCTLHCPNTLTNSSWGFAVGSGCKFESVMTLSWPIDRQFNVLYLGRCRCWRFKRSWGSSHTYSRVKREARSRGAICQALPPPGNLYCACGGCQV
jgi:hypothetical protein